jgi:hypothetical protein
MSEALSKLVSDGTIIPVVAIAGGILCGIVAIITDHWYKNRKNEMNAQLKQEMLARGMSAEEIKTVMEAGSKKSWQC